MPYSHPYKPNPGQTGGQSQPHAAGGHSFEQRAGDLGRRMDEKAAEL